MANHEPPTAPAWDRECVMCAHKWLEGDDEVKCPACENQNTLLGKAELHGSAVDMHNESESPPAAPLGVGVKLRTSNLLPRGAYALMQGEYVVWDSITGPFTGCPEPPIGGWDTVMVSVEDYEALREAAS